MPDYPTCPNCLRFAFGRRAGQLFMRCLPCALDVARQRNEEARRG